MLCYVILSTHPPFGMVVMAFFLAGAGMGFLLAHCNSYMVFPDHGGRLIKATRPKAVKVLGYMHSCYGISLLDGDNDRNRSDACTDYCDSIRFSWTTMVELLFYYACSCFILVDCIGTYVPL